MTREAAAMAVRRLAKGMFGISILGVGGWTMVDTYVSSEGAPAAINSEVQSVRAPLDGYVSLKPLKLGSMVESGQEIVELRPASSDADGDTESELATLRDEIATMEALVKTLREQSNAYRDARVEQLELEVTQSEAKLSAAKAEEKSQAAIRDRQEQLLAGGYALKGTAEAALEASNRAALDRKAAEQALQARRVELDAARKGTFVGDGYNDSFYSRQRADEVALKLIELKAELARQQARHDSVNNEKTGAVAGTAGGRVVLRAMGSGRIWNVAVNQGQFVRRGDTVLEIADCGRLLVNASGAKREYAEIRRGDAASFHFDGHDSTWSGTVSWAGAAGQGILATSQVAFRPQTPVDARYSFMVTLDDTPDLRSSCPVGAPGRITFGPNSGAPPIRSAALESIGHYLSGVSAAFAQHAQPSQTRP
jgi:multidrug resistance efflux pump